MASRAYDAELFAGAAQYYSKFRLGYPRELFDALEQQHALNPSDPVLDLGCGTGHVALDLADKGITVYAVDPDTEMIAEGIRAADQRGLTTIRWMLGTDEQISELKLPPLSMCAMGASFHWMNRRRVLERLGGMIVPNGRVCVFSGRFDLEHTETALWSTLTSEVIKEFLGAERRAGKGTYSHPSKSHEDIFAQSAFAQVRKLQFEQTVSLTVPQIVGLQLSMSYASPVQLGDALTDFKSALAERLKAETDKSSYESVVKHELIIGTR